MYEHDREIQIIDGDEILFTGNILECYKWLQDNHMTYQVDSISFYCDSISVYSR